jgi:DNA-binding NarL/FixJ family response regulator
MSPECKKPVIRIVFVEDERVIQLMLLTKFGLHPDFQVVGQFYNASSATQWLMNNEPNVLLVDLGLPNHSGLTVINHCLSLYPQCNVMVLTMLGDEKNILDSIQAGVKSFVLRSDIGISVVSAVQEMVAGGSPISPIIARLILCRLTKLERENKLAHIKEVSASGLSCRESQVLELLAQGHTYDQTASTLFLSVNTVQSHIKKIYEKLAVNSRIAAIKEARIRGWLKHEH